MVNTIWNRFDLIRFRKYFWWVDPIAPLNRSAETNLLCIYIYLIYIYMLTKEVGIFKVFKISCRKFCFKGNHPAFLKIFFFYKKMFFSCSCRGGENCRGFNQKIKFWTSSIIKIFNFFCCKGYSKKKNLKIFDSFSHSFFVNKKNPKIFDSFSSSFFINRKKNPAFFDSFSPKLRRLQRLLYFQSENEILNIFDKKNLNYFYFNCEGFNEKNLKIFASFSSSFSSIKKISRSLLPFPRSCEGYSKKILWASILFQ